MLFLQFTHRNSIIMMASLTQVRFYCVDDMRKLLICQLVAVAGGDFLGPDAKPCVMHTLKHSQFCVNLHALARTLHSSNCHPLLATFIHFKFLLDLTNINC